MLTDTQRHKAQMKILEQELIDIKKHNAMLNHIKARHFWERFKLPYRVCLDYLKRPKEPGEVELNDCYPFPGYPKDKLISVHFPSDFAKQEDNLYSLNGIYELDNLNDNIREQIKEYNKQFYPGCVLSDNDYEYIRLMVGYDLTKFSEFDWFGKKGVVNHIADIGCMVQVYTKMVEDYEKEVADNPNKYPRHIYTPKELEQYTTHPFNVIWGDSEQDIIEYKEIEIDDL